MSNVSRKNFISGSFFGALTVAATGGISLLNAQDKNKKPDALDKDLVKDFIVKGHNDLDGVKELLSREPGLLNACWDWGGGDFETALEGAGHMGRKDIAQYLIGSGARMNIFCAAMLGQMDIVRSILTMNPDLKSSKGPHGLQLLHHAKKGGDENQAMIEYLQSINAN